jgi:hypothetical protein
VVITDGQAEIRYVLPTSPDGPHRPFCQLRKDHLDGPAASGGPGQVGGAAPGLPVAAELAELLQFLAQWLTRDPGRLGASLEAFVGHPAYNLNELHQDRNRFTFLLGGDDGEALFGPGTAEPGP